MSNKNLPIKFFKKRENDEQFTEGMGGPLPKWIRTEKPKLKTKSLGLSNQLNGIKQSIIQKVISHNFIPTVIKVKLNENAIAKSYRAYVGKIFNTEKFNIIGFIGSDELLVKIDNVSELEQIDKEISDIDKNVAAIASINSIQQFEPIYEFHDNADIIKVKLFNFQDIGLNDVLHRSFETFCRLNKIDFRKSRYGSGLYIYRLLSASVSLDNLKEFDGIFAVTNMPEYKTEFIDVKVEGDINILTPKPGYDYPTVGILDSGISKIRHLTPWLEDRKIAYYTSDAIDAAHGTFVAGILLYGDLLEGNALTGMEGCKIVDATVFPNLNVQSIHEDELVLQIEDAIKKNSDIKIWNLSLGTSDECDLNNFSDFAIALDKLQEEYNVLICKSVGNCTNFKICAPRSRIAKSADSIRSIVVGSIAHKKSDTDLAELMHPSPFTRTGPGPAFLIKPDVVHFGGNAGLNASNDMVYTGVKSFGTDGNISLNVGTSFATPRITALAASLSNRIQEEFNPLLIKSLIIHSSRHPKELEMDLSDKINLTGFGLPPNVNDIIYNDANEITLIMQDTLHKGFLVNILDFPFPQTLIDDNGCYYGEITVTLVNSPILDETQGIEYCQSDLDLKFGTYENKKNRDITRKNIKNPIGADNTQNLLSKGIYSAKKTKNLNMEFAKERILLSYGNKYQPVKKWSIDLEELTEANKLNHLKAPKQWYLKLNGIYRFNTEQKFERKQQVPSQEFSLLITIKDTKKRGIVYNEVAQLLSKFNFIHSNIKVREQIDINTIS